MLLTNQSSATKIPTATNAAIVATQLLTLLTCYLAAARLHTVWPLLALSLAFGLLMNSVYSIVHEAEHAMLFPNRRANEITGVAMALFFPAPFHLIRQGHIGHHLRNRSDDEAFDLYFDGDNVVWRWLCWLGILTGLYYVLVVLSIVVLVIYAFLGRATDTLIPVVALPLSLQRRGER